MLRRHGGDADVEFGTADAHPRRAILRQPPLGDVEPCENFYARDQRLRRNARRRIHRAQQAIDAHAHHEAGAERFDVDVGGAQLDRALQQIVERAHHRRAAGEIAQALDVVVGLLRRSLGAVLGAGLAGIDALVEHRRDVLERGDRDLDGCAEHDFRGANGRGVGRVGHRQPVAAIGGADREDRGFTQKAPRKSVEARRAVQQLRKAEPHHAPIVRDLVGEFGGGQIGRFPQFAQRPGQGGIGGIFDARTRLRRQ